MAPLPFDLELHLHRHGAALRRLAWELLREGAAVDDALQETWLRAAGGEPRHAASVGAWLAAIVRNVALRVRRGEARRRQREQVAAVARGEVTEDHAAVVAREEVAQRVLTALATLDAPYREAIWARFFEGKSPRAIAAASGVPVATVKSRLQRGLGNLRARLGEGDGDGERGDWRRAFAVAFALEKGTAAASAVAAGGVLMATWMKLTGAIAAAAVAVVLWWPSASTSPTAAPLRDDASRPVPAVANLGASNAATPAASTPDAPRTAAPLAAPLDAKLATIRGRCVDEKGAPIAACKVSLDAWECNRERADAWLRDHPEPQWKNPPSQPTGADGVFSFTFWPPPPFQFALHIGSADLAAMSARWDEIAEGRVVDVGDVVMVPGIRVQGRVVDEAGEPVAKASVYVQPGRDQGNGERETPSFGQASAVSERDGSFRCDSSLPPGPCRIQCSGPEGARLVKPVEGMLSRERRIEEIVLVLRLGSTITGRVVDDAGQPIANADVEAREQNVRCSSARSDRDGSFTLRKDERTGGSAMLMATHTLFEPCASENAVEWGSRDIVLVMRAAGGLAVYVRDEQDRAVTDFTVRAVPRQRGWGSSDDGNVRARGPFAAGFAAVPGIQIGKWTVLIEFPSAMQTSVVVVPIEKTANDTLRIDVTARTDAQRTVRVVDANDEPVAGICVQLCMQFDGDFGDNAFVGSIDQLRRVASGGTLSRALLLMEGKTAADGALVVAGPRQVSLGVAVAGQGHNRVCIGGVRLDEPSPLVIRVSQGARVRGHVTPPAGLSELLRLFGATKAELRLVGSAPARRAVPIWFEHGFPIADDGAFDIASLPTGRWRVVIQAGSSFDLGEVDLREGQTTQFDPDLAFLLPGTMKGMIHFNGAPLRNSTIQFQRIEGGPVPYLNATTDADGGFAMRMHAGSYRAVVTGQAKQNWARYRSMESATVTVGHATEQVFHIWTGKLKLTVRDSRGAPVEGVHVRIAGADPAERTWPSPSDAQGLIESEITAEAVAFEVLPKRMQSGEAQQKLREKMDTANGDPVEACWLPLGTATVIADQTTKLEVRLPAGWDK